MRDIYSKRIRRALWKPFETRNTRVIVVNINNKRRNSLSVKRNVLILFNYVNVLSIFKGKVKNKF